jgi:hypothetical protein
MSAEIMWSHQVVEEDHAPTKIPPCPPTLVRIDGNTPAPGHQDGMFCAGSFWMWAVRLALLEAAAIAVIVCVIR